MTVYRINIYGPEYFVSYDRALEEAIEQLKKMYDRKVIDPDELSGMAADQIEGIRAISLEVMLGVVE